MGCSGSKAQPAANSTPTPSAPSPVPYTAPAPTPAVAPAPAPAAVAGTATAAPPSAPSTDEHTDDTTRLAALEQRLEKLRKWDAAADARLDNVTAAIAAAGHASQGGGEAPAHPTITTACDEANAGEASDATLPGSSGSGRDVVRRESAFGRDFGVTPEQAQDLYILQEHFPSSPTHVIMDAYNKSECDVTTTLDTLLQEESGIA